MDKKEQVKKKINRQAKSRVDKMTKEILPKTIPHYNHNPYTDARLRKTGGEAQKSRMLYSINSAIGYYFPKPTVFLMDDRRRLLKEIAQETSTAKVAEANKAKDRYKLWANVILKRELLQGLDAVLSIRKIPLSVQKSVTLQKELANNINQNYF
jgi:hypothetical protein